MLDMGQIEERLEDVLAVMLERAEKKAHFASPFTSIPKVKKAGMKLHRVGGETPEPAGTRSDKPSAKAKDDGDGTKAGVKPKGVDGDGTKAGVKPKFDKNAGTKEAPAVKKKPSAAGGKPPSCPGGAEPRMVFGKWRCSGSSKGATAGKKRVAAKRAKKKAPPKMGALGKMVMKARKALKGLFK